MNFEEKRKHRRIAIQFPIDYKGKRIFQYKQGKNIGIGGLFIETENIEEFGTEVVLEFSFPHEETTLEAEGVVRWSRLKPFKDNKGKVIPAGMGIMFTKISDAVRQKIEELVENYPYNE